MKAEILHSYFPSIFPIKENDLQMEKDNIIDFEVRWASQMTFLKFPQVKPSSLCKVGVIRLPQSCFKCGRIKIMGDFPHSPTCQRESYNCQLSSKTNSDGQW